MKKKRLNFWSILLISIVVILFLGVYSYNKVSDGLFGASNRHGTTFTTVLWNKYPEERKYIIDDFLLKNDIKKMNRQQIVTLLGEPQKNDSLTKNEISYYLGHDYIDPYVLVISIDEKGNVVEGGVHR